MREDILAIDIAEIVGKELVYLNQKSQELMIQGRMREAKDVYEEIMKLLEFSLLFDRLVSKLSA